MPAEKNQGLGEMDFEMALAALLQDFDEAVSKWRRELADPKHLNPESKEMKAVNAEVQRLANDIMRLKNLQDDLVQRFYSKDRTIICTDIAKRRRGRERAAEARAEPRPGSAYGVSGVDRPHGSD